MGRKKTAKTDPEITLKLNPFNENEDEVKDEDEIEDLGGVELEDSEEDEAEALELDEAEEEEEKPAAKPKSSRRKSPKAKAAASVPLEKEPVVLLDTPVAASTNTAPSSPSLESLIREVEASQAKLAAQFEQLSAKTATPSRAQWMAPLARLNFALSLVALTFGGVSLILSQSVREHVLGHPRPRPFIAQAPRPESLARAAAKPHEPFAPERTTVTETPSIPKAPVAEIVKPKTSKAKPSNRDTHVARTDSAEAHETSPLLQVKRRVVRNRKQGR